MKNLLICLLFATISFRAIAAGGIYVCNEPRVIDGDTVECILGLGFNVFLKKSVRLLDVNAPEIRTKNEREKLRGLYIKKKLEKYLHRFSKSDLHFIHSPHHRDKYGRAIGELHISSKTMGLINVNFKINEWIQEPYEPAKILQETHIPN